MSPGIQMAINLLLHESSVEEIELDTGALRAVCTLELSPKPIFGSAPANPCTLRLEGLTRLRVALINADGTTPPKAMDPIPLGYLNRLVRHFRHPQQGFDFLDSSRDDISRGLPVVDWIATEPVSPHTLTFFFGVQSPEGRAAILLLRFWFQEFDFRAADGSAIDLRACSNMDALAKATIPVIQVPGSAPEMSQMPDPIPAQLADAASVALLFVDSKTKVTRSRAIGKGVWTGTELKWLSPGRALYDMPDRNQFEIRPALAEWAQAGDPMGGFAFWTTVEITEDDPINPRELVEKYLRSSSAAPRADS